MPRYMFDVEDHIHDQDDRGMELPGPAEARAEAVAYLGAILRDDPGVLEDGAELRVRVHEIDGPEICCVFVRAVDKLAD